MLGETILITDSHTTGSPGSEIHTLLIVIQITLPIGPQSSPSVLLVQLILTQKYNQPCRSVHWTQSRVRQQPPPPPPIYIIRLTGPAKPNTANRFARFRSINITVDRLVGPLRGRETSLYMLYKRHVLHRQSSRVTHQSHLDQHNTLHKHPVHEDSDTAHNHQVK